jgi:hypothetical protein
LEQFQQQLTKQTDYDLLAAGNWREIQEIDDHDVMEVVASVTGDPFS